MSLIKDINEMAIEATLSTDQNNIVNRLVGFWSERSADMSDDELREAIAIDLENIAGIDGDPAVVEKLVPIIVSMIRKN